MLKNFLFPLLENQSDSGGGELSDDLAQDLKDLESEESEEEGEKVSADEDKEDDKDDDDEPLLGDLDEEEDEDEEEEKEEKRVKKEKEEDEEEEEEEETEPERDESGRPTIKAIKSKYPDIFKTFPELKRSYFVLPRYEQIFADPDQAQEAAEKAREFDELEGSLVGKADPSSLIQILAENNPRALKKIISNFSDAVRGNFEEGYIELARPILEELVYTAFQHGTKIGDKNLILSARHMANFVWSNGGEIPDISKRTKTEPSEAERQLEVERNRNAQTHFINAARDIMPKAEEALTGFIMQNLKGLTRFERQAIIKETMQQVNKKLEQDKSLQTSLGHLWTRAKAEDYSDASKERVKNAWLSRAKAVAIPIRNKLREEALGARSDKSSKLSDDRKEGKRTFPSHGGREARNRPKVLDPSKIDWSKTSDMDILNSK
jgi:hypothetical protein